MTAVAALNGTYFLLKRFRMPQGNHSIDAVAVEIGDGGRIHSAYTLMIKFCIMQFWSLVVLCGVVLFITKKDPQNHTHNRTAATVGIWNAQASPTTSAFLAARYVFRMKGDILYPLIWTCLAAGIIVSSIIAPILLTNFLEIGQVAPVNPASIFVPDINLFNPILSKSAKFSVMQNSATFRAVGTEKNQSVTVIQEGAGQNLTIKYGYKVTGTDFGLQRVPDLMLNVDGSCTTEYGWLQPPRNNHTVNSYTDVTDEYFLFGNQPVNVSSKDGGSPFATFHRNRSQTDFGKFENYSYAIVISSVQRFSLSPSDDPWYQTTDFTAKSPDGQNSYDFVVRSGRPVLSCWETNKWSYQGQDGNLDQLVNLTGGKLSQGLQQTFYVYTLPPAITGIGTRLGRSSLTAAASTIGEVFDAERSTILKDMTRLVQASYTATVNVFKEATMLNDPGSFGFTNLLYGTNKPGIGEFVLYSPDVRTLSVKTLIVVPVVLVTLLALNLLVIIVPGPWRMVEALHAAVIYSHLHEQANDSHIAVAGTAAADSTRPKLYTRGSSIAWTREPIPATIQARYGKKSGPIWEHTR